MKTSKSIRIVKKHLIKKVDSTEYNDNPLSSEFICMAAAYAKQAVVGKIVKDLLGNHATLLTFVEESLKKNNTDEFNAALFLCKSNPITFRNKMQATRHAWLDHLIKHYESIGD